MKFLNLIKDLRLISLEMQEDELKNFFILAQWQSPQLLASGKYDNGKNKGTVSISASNFHFFQDSYKSD
jgi:hypothetical protein